MPLPITPAPRTPIVLIIFTLSSYSFKYHRRRLAPSVTQRGQTIADLPAVQLPDDGGSQPAAAGADGVAEGDGSAVDVDLGWVQLQLPDGDECHRGEGLVDL